MKLRQRLLALLLASAMALCTAACGSSTETTTETDTSATEGTQEDTTAAEETDAAESEAADGAAAGTTDLAAGDYVIGLSNSFYGNTWRRQMVDSFTQAAEEAKSEGYIADYEIQNGDNTVNTQIAQINSFILEGVDAICINAASSTALNDVIQQAMDQ